MKFDATLKTLLEESPADWPALAGYPARRVEVIDADISTVSGAADKVLRVCDPSDWILHIEFQASPDANLPRRLNVYNAVLEDRHELPVRTVLVLLHRAAVLKALNGVYRLQLPGERGAYRTFSYQIIRVWELPIEPLLQGGLGTMALAPLGAVTEADLPVVLEEMKRRLAHRKYRGHREIVWAATYVLMGLRYQQPVIDRLLEGVLGMEESVTYQAIIAKGKELGRAEGRAEGALEELRKVLLGLGQKEFGQPANARVRARLEAITNLELLEQLVLQVPDKNSWDELLPAPRKRTFHRS